MRLLLDTRAFIWWLAGSEQMSSRARRAIEDGENEILISAASAWEIATKHRLGRPSGVQALAADIAGSIASQDFKELPISVADAARGSSLPGPHHDPFDRMLIAQSLARNLALVSNEPLFDRYNVRRIW